MDKVKICKYIEDYAKEHNIRVSKIEKEIGLSRGYCSRILSNNKETSDFSLDAFYKLSQFVGIDMNILYNKLCVTKKQLIYISHPSSGKLENTLDVETIIRELYKNDELYEHFCFVSPIHCYGFMYDDTEYYKGLSFCTDLLIHCDAMLVFGDWLKSTGCKEEVKVCENENIPYIIIRDSSKLSEYINNNLCDKILSSIHIQKC